MGATEDITKKPNTSRRGGLRRKFFVKVVIPPLIPLLILGAIGFYQLTSLVRVSLVDQLKRASETTAARVEREFSIRRTVLTRTGEEIFAIRDDFIRQRTSLKAKVDSCKGFIRAATSGNFGGRSFINFDDFISKSDCAPFLYKFAKYSGNNSPTVGKLQADLDDAYRQLTEGDTELGIRGINREEREKIADRFSSFKLFFPETQEIALIDNGGATLEQSGRDGGKTEYIAGREDIRKGALGGEIITPVSEALGKRVATVGYRAVDGAILASYDLEHEKFLKPALLDSLKPHKDDQIYISDSEGNIATARADSNPKRTEFLKQVATGRRAEQSYDEGGQTMLGQGHQVPGIKWAVVTASPESRILSPLKNIQLLMGAAILLTLLVSLAVGFFFVTSATKAIEKLVVGALTFARGDLDSKIYLMTGDELETLAVTMNEMAVKLKAAEQAVIEKSKEFINVTSHELKAPITGIAGFLSMIIDDGAGKLDKQAKEFVTEAYEQTKRLQSLVMDLLDVARLEAKREEFKIEPIDLGALMTDAAKLHSMTAKTQKITLGLNAAPGLKVMADVEKLRIILNNFISNAIKYNRSGGSVSVSARLEGQMAVVEVADTGGGISPDDQAKLFQKFYRTQSAKRSGVSGTGLGLYITKQFVETMGGRVWMESKIGAGTTFYFSLPLAV